MNVTKVNLETVCGITSKLPDNSMPEIAFAGKSNVGKSSLINGLMNRKAYARTSQQPGKTQTINYYNINELLYFVDLPGYGYAKVSKEMQAKWGKLIERYLHTSMMYDWIVNNGFNPVIIATKLDKLKRSQVQKHVKVIRTGLNLVEGTPIFPYSALTKQGRDEIWEFIEEYVLTPEEEITEE